MVFVVVQTMFFFDQATDMEGIGTITNTVVLTFLCELSVSAYYTFSVLTQNTCSRTYHLQDAHLIE